jgi:hypothetical protein
MTGSSASGERAATTGSKTITLPPNGAAAGAGTAEAARRRAQELLRQAQALYRARPDRRRWLPALGWLLGGVALFACYLRLSRTAPANSDGAANALQAWDMLHGNLLLHGWWLSDVSFYTTELPQYMLVELARGLGPDVVHVAAAMTYTLLVLLAALLAKGRTAGREAALRVAVAAGIMLGPQLGAGVGVLLLSPDHVGSAVPVLLVWLLLDRAPRAWYVPVLAGAMLAWGLIADKIVLITGVFPIAVVCLIRCYRAIVAERRPARAQWYEFSLIVASLVAADISIGVIRLISQAGGFTVWPVAPLLTVSGEMPRHFAYTAHGLLVLFGADFFGEIAGLHAGLIMLHLAGLALAGWAVCIGLRRFARTDLVGQLVTAAVLVSIVAYLLGDRVTDLMSTREIAAVLPFGAVLAGRLLPARLARARLVPALAMVLAGYLIGLGQALATPSAPPMGQQLATWLAAHHLRYGLGTYWQASIVSLTTQERVMVVPVTTVQQVPGSPVVHDRWESQASWYDPRQHRATFVVQMVKPGALPAFLPDASLQATFGRPAKVYPVGPYRILVYRQNLLTQQGSQVAQQR